MDHESISVRRAETLIPSRYLLVVLTFLLSLLLYIDRVCISAATDSIRPALELSEKQMGWVLSAFALGYALFQTPGGLLADRLGPRVILTAVVGFWSLFTGLTAAARSLCSMLVVRFLFGAGEAEYLRHGDPRPAETLATEKRVTEGVLIGAMGSPSVRWPDGSELKPQIDLWRRLALQRDGHRGHSGQRLAETGVA